MSITREETKAGADAVTTSLRAANIARQAEWCPDLKPDLSFRGCELAGETGEVCNVIKKLERERQGWAGSRDTLTHLAEELADVVICADLVAIAAGIDLDAAVIAKFNATSEKVGLATRLAAATTPSPAEGIVEEVPQDGLKRLHQRLHQPLVDAEERAAAQRLIERTRIDRDDARNGRWARFEMSRLREEIETLNARAEAAEAKLAETTAFLRAAETGREAFRLRAEAAEAREAALRRALKMHHDWNVTQVEAPDGTGGADAYGESVMCDVTLAALSTTKEG